MLLGNWQKLIIANEYKKKKKKKHCKESQDEKYNETLTEMANTKVIGITNHMLTH